MKKNIIDCLKFIEISQGSLNKYLDSKYSEKSKLKSRKSIFSIINYFCILLIFVLSILITQLTFNLKVDENKDN